MRRRLQLSAIAFAIAAASLSQARAEDSPVLPGYWESTEAYSVLLSGANHTRRCLTQAQVAEFITAPQTKHYRCVYTERQVGGGRAVFRGGSCYSHSGRRVLSGVGVDGTYTPETFHLRFRFNLMVSAGVGLPGTASIDAQRISAECPAESPPGG